MLVYDYVTTLATASSLLRISMTAAFTGVTLRNSIGIRGLVGARNPSPGSTLRVENCTFHAMGVSGVIQAGGGGAVTVLNTIATASNLDFDNNGGMLVQSFNVSSDATAAGLGSKTMQAPSALFVSVTAGAEDLHLLSSAMAVDAGSTQSSFMIDIDGDGRPRGIEWDIGADEH